MTAESAAGYADRRVLWARAQVVAGAAILAILVWRLGTGPFVHGARTVSGWSLATAVGIAALTTLCGAWRWRLVARGLGVELPLPSAVAASYRAQFLNTMLPGGVLGDLHRAVRHGREIDDVGRGVRAVAWERSAGQLVQALLAMAVLLALPSPVRSSMPVIVVAVLVLGGLSVVLLSRALLSGGASRWARALGTAHSDLRDGLLGWRALTGIALASVVVVAGHTATFLVAARTAGSTASLLRLLPLALIALLAMGLPLNIGGWGPREGVAAWAFGTAGMGVSQGVATAVVYGVMVLVASLPGALVLVAELLRRSRAPESTSRLSWRIATTSSERAARG